MLCMYIFCYFLQESLDSDATLTLVYEPCLPGYFQMNKKCVCEENDVIVQCDPKSRGLVLTVSAVCRSVLGGLQLWIASVY